MGGWSRVERDSAGTSGRFIDCARGGHWMLEKPADGPRAFQNSLSVTYASQSIAAANDPIPLADAGQLRLLCSELFVEFRENYL
jgi:hypothetical protein